MKYHQIVMQLFTEDPQAFENIWPIWPEKPIPNFIWYYSYLINGWGPVKAFTPSRIKYS